MRSFVYLVVLATAVFVPAASQARLRSPSATPPPPGTIAFLRACCEILGDGQTDVYEAPADGTGSPRAVTHLMDVTEASWSPDRRWIAITRPPFNEVLWVMRSSGGKFGTASGLHRISTGTGDVSGPIWSSDGRLIAYSQAHAGGGGVWVSTTGGPPKRVASGFPVAWNPILPRELAYLADEHLYVADVAHHTEHRLFGNKFAGSVSWSPDGRRIVAYLFSNLSQPTRGGDDYVYSLSSGKTTNLSRTGTATGNAAWSPDGRRIAWSSRSYIWLANFDGSGKRRLAAIDKSYLGAVWSPDGHRIAWSTSNAIWVANTDGSRTRRLTSDEPKYTTDLGPIWAPDGRSLIFVHDVAGLCQLYQVSLEGSAASPLFAPQDQPTGNNACDYNPVWLR